MRMFQYTSGESSFGSMCISRMKDASWYSSLLQKMPGMRESSVRWIHHRARKPCTDGAIVRSCWRPEGILGAAVSSGLRPLRLGVRKGEGESQRSANALNSQIQWSSADLHRSYFLQELGALATQQTWTQSSWKSRHAHTKWHVIRVARDIAADGGTSLKVGPNLRK